MFSLDDHPLNDEQKAAIRADGNVFLVACPGSGKTRTLTFKIAHELTGLQSDKQFVIAITYTHRAADEIYDRVERLGIDTSQLWIGTIHAFCLEWILKPYYVYHASLRNGFRVIDPHDREALLTEICKPYKYPTITHWDCEYYFVNSGYVSSCNDTRKEAGLREILNAYFHRLTANRQIDFELILFYAYQVIAANPAISILLSKIFSRILIDEYQDTKAIQYDIVASILRAGKSATGVFMVGDPNQAIFRSLGGYAITAAEFKAMAEIELKEMSLSRNYRSSERIIKYFGNYNVVPATIEPASAGKGYSSRISYDRTTTRAGIEDEVVRLIKYNTEVEGIHPHEICVLAPQWVHLAGMTRQLAQRLPEYQFDGPGMVPFARDIHNFWYKVSKIALTEPSPSMYLTRLRWAGEVLAELHDVGTSVSSFTHKDLLRECNSIKLHEVDGLKYLRMFFDALFLNLGIDFHSIPALREHYDAFFESSQARIARLAKDGSDSISDITTFRRVFAARSGITVSTIHGVKGAEYDTVIAYGLLQGMLPHFSDPDGQESAKKLLYVICSRARKNLHLISEKGRLDGRHTEYLATTQLAKCSFSYDSIP
jgi:DNA helicase II / ATP-dependent DNA helicase PcrA